MYTYFYKECPIGPLWIMSDGEAICAVYLEKDAPHPIDGENPDALCRSCAAQLREYFAGERKAFDLPLKMQGTDFQKKVWTALLQIPYGTTVTYGDLAALAGHPKAARAVGTALRGNPLWLLIPCHRVVSAAGLGGYGGPQGTPIKLWLLKLEGALCESKRD
ncbi:MAG: methylated-DNA--[protein]-cysteine S-methyltransferase [Clostridiales bacterium]|jgi:methylated-DNA-[protein]-cysteine S-methyltransferase|nr:methylated-DNA--[protein]-cysteine S-methyltransferase [Clostridiales bacterium]